jgi:lipoyl(octanoyl) transferase
MSYSRQYTYQWVDDSSYESVWDLQTKHHRMLIDQKRAALDQNLIDYVPDHKLILCHHRPVFTLGKSGSMDHLLLTEEELSTQNIEFFKINRGGDITYHGPGQITGYPILDMDSFYHDVHRYVRELEEAVILTLQHYEIIGMRIPDYTGVWIAPDDDNIKYRKVCAIGVHMSRWVTLHGFALNVNTDLSFFERIVPCGIVDEDKQVTSIERELGRSVDIHEVAEVFLASFDRVFNAKRK